MKCIETSGQENLNVKEAFETLVFDIYNAHKTGVTKFTKSDPLKIYKESNENKSSCC